MVWNSINFDWYLIKLMTLIGHVTEPVDRAFHMSRPKSQSPTEGTWFPSKIRAEWKFQYLRRFWRRQNPAGSADQSLAGSERVGLKKKFIKAAHDNLNPSQKLTRDSHGVPQKIANENRNKWGHRSAAFLLIKVPPFGPSNECESAADNWIDQR